MFCLNMNSFDRHNPSTMFPHNKLWSRHNLADHAFKLEEAASLNIQVWTTEDVNLKKKKKSFNEFQRHLSTERLIIFNCKNVDYAITT